MRLILYSTVGCHLCEQALLHYQALDLSALLYVQDIAFDDALFARYGVKIPVLSLQTQQGQRVDELPWPFDSVQLQRWLKQYGIN